MQLLHINPVEHVSVDQDRLGALYSQLGASGAEDIVCRALEELALRLSHCETLFRSGCWPELRKNVRSLIAISDQIGMSALSHRAKDVTRCIDQQDITAVAATLSRLMRIGEGSLTAVWDLHDLPV